MISIFQRLQSLSHNPKNFPSLFALLLILFGGSFLYFMAPERTSETPFFTSTISYNVQTEISLDFTDVASTDWFYSYLQTLVSEGVIDNAATPFRPNDSLNRAELVKIVIELLRKPILSQETPSFQDVSSGSWYYGYVETAAALGIVEGYRDADGALTGYFGPADTVNRAQAVKIFIKAFSLEGSAGSSTFPDVSATAWYAPYVSSAATLGIVNGYENGNFGPGDSVTRAQITKIAVKSEEAGGGGVVVVDEDGDGFSTDDDCDDSNASVYPGAAEICEDNIDQDCTGGDLPCDPVDNDGDGYFPETGDCDDTNAAVHPSATETCGDGIDQDCSGADLSCSDVDNDGDSYTENDGDCNDSSATVYPAAPEVCGDGIDQNCDSQDTSCDTKDNDGDGYSSAAGDCDDTRASVHPGASEIAYSGLDEDCDAKTPDDDLDGDSYRKEKDCKDSDGTIYPGATEKCGDSIDQDCSGTDLSCKDVDDDKDGYTENQGDCNDTSASIKPSASETCGDSVDQNCDGKDLSCNDVDNDGDGYTETAGDCDDASASISPKGTETCGDGVDQDCSLADLVCSDMDNDKDGYSTTEGDCNDADASIYPNVSEKCDSIDNDCDGQKDEGLSTDSDKDGYTAKTSCEGTKNDCDDSKASVYVGATETCGDGIDQDCSGADLTCSAVDTDKDGYSTTAGDCNDSNASIHPGASETCDGVDNDCDSQKDEGLTADSDKDGYSSKTSCEGTKNDCDDSKASVYVGATETCGDGIDQDCSGADLTCSKVDNDKDGYSTTEGDCNDSNVSIYPGASETCNGVDDDCDTQKDEGLTSDVDKDGYSSKTSCEGTKNDCDDSKASVYVGATETCGDSIDQDCSGADLSCNDVDNDSDGYTENQGDCNDASASVKPGATETCGDGIDQNCSGKDLPCATANPCDSIEGINEDVCSGYYTASEEYVCACPVATVSASDPFCEIPSNKSSAQLYFTSSYSNDLYQYKKLGTKYIPYHQYFGSVSFNGSSISYEETGQMDTFLGSCSDSAKENCPYYSWIEAVPSPSDAAFLALYEQADNLLSDGNSANDDDVSGIDKKARYAGIAGCASGSDPGFRLDHFLQNLTAPLVRWGSKTGTEREMYAMISDMYRILFSPNIAAVTQTGSGNAVDAMVVKSSTLLGRTSSASTAFADFDVTFQSGKDTYAVFLESLPPSAGIYDYSNELAITRINLMDLNNCDFSRCTGDSSVKFCCKTAVLIESTLDFWPTNPALNENGDLISFNRFGVSLGMFGDPYSQYYVMKNPFKNSTLLSSCVTSDGQDGFGKPVDCTPLISKSDGAFDYNECPNYSCCGSSGVDCSTCVSMGRNNYDGVTDGSGTVICDDNSDALRSLNWVVFLKQSINDYVTYFSKTAGNAIDEDFYKIRLSGDQFVLDTPGVVPLTRISITDFEVMPGVTFHDFLLAPFRK